MSHRWFVLLCMLALLVSACSFGARRAPSTGPIMTSPPTAIPTAGWRALQEAYLVATDRAGRNFDRLFVRRSLYENTVKYQHLWCEAFMAIDVEFTESVEKIPWTEEYQAQVDKVLKETADIIAILKKCTKSKSLKTIKSLENKADQAYLERQKASEQLRKDLHLSTAPMR